MKIRNALIFIIVLIIIIFSVVTVTLFFTAKESIYFILNIGILASLIASIIYGLFNFLLLKQPIAERDELKSLITEFRKRELNGIKNICHKFEQNPEYWNGFLASATQKLDMLGHAFTTWTHEPHKEFFAKKIIQIIKNEGTVRIVILSPDSDNTKKLTKRVGKPYKDRVNETLQFFSTNIIPKLGEKQLNRLLIKLENESDIPFMYINNGSNIIVSPYYSKAIDSKDNLVIQFSLESKFGGSYSSDFDQVFSQAIEWRA